jgi:hypothetical protein
MFVMADNLESFFDFILDEMKKDNAKQLKTDTHLHDAISAIKKQIQ